MLQYQHYGQGVGLPMPPLDIFGASIPETLVTTTRYLTLDPLLFVDWHILPFNVKDKLLS